MSGPVTGLQLRSSHLHASPEALAAGAAVEAEIPPPTVSAGFLPCAYWWLDAGFVVFPLYPANEPVGDGDGSDMAKKPNGRLVGDGNTAETIGTTDPDQVAEWWRDEPASGVAVVAPTSRVLIVDIDPKNNGWASFLPFCARHGIDLAEVPRSTSPRGDGGVHLFWAVPTGTTYLFGRFLAGVDRPWQVPVPPSPRWVQTGTDRKGGPTFGWANYTWLAGDPRVLPMAPTALLGAPAASSSGPGGSSGGASGSTSVTDDFDGDWADDGVLPITEYGSIDHSRLEVHPIPVGDQNKAFKRIACSMVRYHAADAAIIGRLLELAAMSPVGDPRNPWTRTDMERVTRHARRFVEGERRKELAAAEAARTEGLTKMERWRRMAGI